MFEKKELFEEIELFDHWIGVCECVIQESHAKLLSAIIVIIMRPRPGSLFERCFVAASI